jgi:hypothetical protein
MWVELICKSFVHNLSRQSVKNEEHNKYMSVEIIYLAVSEHY